MATYLNLIAWSANLWSCNDRWLQKLKHWTTRLTFLFILDDNESCEDLANEDQAQGAHTEEEQGDQAEENGGCQAEENQADEDVQLSGEAVLENSLRPGPSTQWRQVAGSGGARGGDARQQASAVAHFASSAWMWRTCLGRAF